MIVLLQTVLICEKWFPIGMTHYPKLSLTSGHSSTLVHRESVSGKEVHCSQARVDPLSNLHSDRLTGPQVVARRQLP